MREKLKKKLKELPEVPFESALEYERKQDILIYELMTKIDNMGKELNFGDFTRGELEEVHRAHVKSMAVVFKLNNYELFLNNLLWAYRVSKLRGVDEDFYITIYNNWIALIDKNIEPALSKQLKDVYEWLIDNHELMKESSMEGHFYPFGDLGSWQKVQDNFLEAILKGNHKKCLEISDQTIKSGEDLEDFYLKVIKPSLYKIGIMWEKGEISVPHEHLATSIISRVMANLYTKFILVDKTEHKNAVITACPNEFHEIGARMVADLLEKDGWNVNYLGANVPEKELIDMLIEDPPFLLGISVAMPYNVDKVISMINNIKNNSELNGIKILVGGKIFLENPDLWEKTGADEFAADASKAVIKANKLLEGDLERGC